MLWLAGLMGMMAVGAVGVASAIDLSVPPEETENDADQSDESVASDGDPSLSVMTDEFESNDLLEGSPRNDILFGKEGDDTLNGNAGDDTLAGDDGNDILIGGDGDDEMFGHNADDQMSGGAGNDAMQGSAGDDVLRGDAGNDAVQGGLDNDTLDGGLGADSLFGGWGDDALNGMVDDKTTAETDDVDERDFLNGGGGDDVIVAGENDVVTAGDGSDVIVAGSWIEEGGTADVTDFDATEDSILLIYDDDIDEPDVSLHSDPGSPETTQVLMNGIAVANILNGAEISIGDVALMPLSSAQAVGMAPL